MAFTLPTFNLFCNVSTQGLYPTVRASFVCNLAYGRRVNVASTGGTLVIGVPLVTMSLLLPPLVDVRGPLSTTGADVIEVPAGSGRTYQVAFVDDIGKGFTNEHRVAILEQRSQPTPLT
jgi:hypothetical protein